LYSFRHLSSFGIRFKPRARALTFVALVLHPRHHNTFYKVLLAHEVHQDARHDAHAGARHCQSPIRAIATRKAFQPQRDGVHFLLCDVYRLLQHVVPDADEDEQRHHNDRGLDAGHKDLQKNAHPPRAVNLGGLVQLARYRHDELPDQKDVECASARQVRQDQRPVGAAKPQNAYPPDVQGDERNHRRQQERCDTQPKHKAAPTEVQPRERVAAQHRRDRAKHHTGHRDGHGVAKEAEKREYLECLRVVAHQPLAGQQVQRADLRVGHQR